MSTFGRLYKVTTYGESHGASVGAIIDGCPPVRALFLYLHWSSYQPSYRDCLSQPKIFKSNLVGGDLAKPI